MKFTNYLICALFLLIASKSIAQVGQMPEDAEKSKEIYLTIGYDNSMLTSGIGIAKGFNVDKINRTLLVNAEVALPVGNFDFNDYRVKLGSRIDIYKNEPWRIPIEANFILNGTSNGTFKATGIGTEFNLIPGYYGEKWFFAAELGWRQQWQSHIEYSDFYRNYFYPEAKDGWLATPSSNFQAGVRVGLLIKNRFDLLLRAAYKSKGVYENLSPPLLAVLSVGYRF